MNATVLTVPGTVTADGALELDAKLNLPPGRVTVTVQPAVVPLPAKDPFMEGLERIWADQKARGHVPRTKEEIDAELKAMRDEDEERMQAMEQLHEECHQARLQSKPAKERTP